MAREESVSIALGKVLDQSGYLQDLREERSEEAEGRIENLAELVSAAREYESREAEPSLGGFVDRLSLLSDVGRGAGHAGRAGLDDDAAQRQGPGVSHRGDRRPRRRAVPALALAEDEEELEEERRLCYVGMTRARATLVLTGAARRRVFGEYQSSEPSRFIDEIPAELIDRLLPSYSSASRQGNFPHYEFRTNPYGRRPARQGRAAGVFVRGRGSVSRGVAASGHARQARAVRHRDGASA